MSFLDTFAEAGNKILQAEHPFISDVYCDLEFLQDLRFGALLLNLKSAEEMTYVYAQIDHYNERLDERTTTYFPSLKLTEEVIDKSLNDPVSFQKIACFAPMTSMFYNLTSIIGMILRSNKYAETNVNKILQLWISVDNLNYPKELLKQLAENLEETFNKKIVVNTGCAKRYTQSLEYFLSKKMLFLYDFEQFVNRPAIAMPFASEGLFTEHQIFARPQVNPRFASLNRKELLSGVDKMRDQLGIYCDFEYCPSQIVIRKDK